MVRRDDVWDALLETEVAEDYLSRVLTGTIFLQRLLSFGLLLSASGAAFAASQKTGAVGWLSILAAVLSAMNFALGLSGVINKLESLVMGWQELHVEWERLWRRAFVCWPIDEEEFYALRRRELPLRKVQSAIPKVRCLSRLSQNTVERARGVLR